MLDPSVLKPLTVVSFFSSLVVRAVCLFLPRYPELSTDTPFYSIEKIHFSNIFITKIFTSKFQILLWKYWQKATQLLKLIKAIIWFESIHIYRPIIEHDNLCIISTFSQISRTLETSDESYYLWWYSFLKIVFSDDIELTTHEKSLLQKCLNLIHHRFPSVFHQQNYMTSNNTTTKTINEQGNLSNILRGPL